MARRKKPVEPAHWDGACYDHGLEMPAWLVDAVEEGRVVNQGNGSLWLDSGQTIYPDQRFAPGADGLIRHYELAAA